MAQLVNSGPLHAELATQPMARYRAEECLTWAVAWTRINVPHMGRDRSAQRRPSIRNRRLCTVPEWTKPDRCLTPVTLTPTISPLPLSSPQPLSVTHQRAQLLANERDGWARGRKVYATTSPLADARAHWWVDALPSSGFSVVPYGVLGRQQLDGRASASTRTTAQIHTGGGRYTMAKSLPLLPDDDDLRLAATRRQGDGPSAQW
jgi:hypothetical protein